MIVGLEPSTGVTCHRLAAPPNLIFKYHRPRSPMLYYHLHMLARYQRPVGTDYQAARLG